MYKIGVLVTAVSLFAACGKTTKADFVYSLSLAPLSTTLEPGQTTKVSLILNETDVAGANSPTSLVSGSGLFGIAVRLQRTSGDATLSNFSLTSGLSALGVNPSPNPTQTPNLWEFNVNAGLASVGTGSRTSIVVGTVDVTLQTESSTFQSGNLTNPLPNNLSLGTFVNSRATSISTYGDLTITAVPEPSTLILVGLAASSMGAAAWRKRKRLLKRTQVNG